MGQKLLTATLLLLAAALLTGVACQQGTPKRRPVPSLTNDDVVAPSGGGKVARTPQPAAADATINWQHELNGAISEAAPDGKLIVVDVYTDWCGWCKRMDQNVYADPQVAGLAQDVVFLKLDAEDGAEGQGFARQYEVTGYPTTIILDHEGRFLTRKVGYIASAQFIAWVESARGQARQ